MKVDENLFSILILFVVMSIGFFVPLPAYLWIAGIVLAFLLMVVVDFYKSYKRQKRIRRRSLKSRRPRVPMILFDDAGIYFPPAKTFCSRCNAPRNSSGDSNCPYCGKLYGEDHVKPLTARGLGGGQ